MPDRNGFENRRGMERTDVDGHALVRVAVRVGQRGTYAGAVRNLCASGAGVDLPAGFAAGIEEGTVVQLAFRVKGSPTEVVVEAALRRRVTTGGCSYCGFEFERAVEFESSEERQRLGALFNERGAPRVCPHPNEPVEAALHTEEGSVPGRMANLSTSGVAVDMDLKDWARVARAATLELELALPGRSEPLPCACTVRRHVLGDSLQLGLAFDWERTAGAGETRAAIQAWIESQGNAHLLRAAA